jgi:CheY-like chemotaxis protein
MGDVTTAENLVRVLVIEDNVDDSELLLRQLEKSGMASHVKFISDGREALDFLTVDAVASGTSELIAILLDLRLPSVSGIEILRRIRQHDRLQSLPVIVMTSSNDPQDLEECRRLNVTHYVSKPITFASFSKAVADVFHLPKTSPAPGGGIE